MGKDVICLREKTPRLGQPGIRDWGSTTLQLWGLELLAVLFLTFVEMLHMVILGVIYVKRLYQIESPMESLEIFITVPLNKIFTRNMLTHDRVGVCSAIPAESKSFLK